MSVLAVGSNGAPLSLRDLAVSHGPIDDLASADNVIVTVEATLTSDPRFSRGTGFGARRASKSVSNYA